MSKKNNQTIFYVQMAIVIVLIGVLMFFVGKSASEGNIGIAKSTSTSKILPTGVPAIYGAELKISFDDVSETTPQKADSTIEILSNIDRSETLEGAELDRYINILYTLENGISCEFCCGARSVIFEDGTPACGCAHSYAMRGLTKYLIKFHGDEYTDAEILEEVGKWKVLFFPGIHETKAEVLKSQGIEINYINLASNKYRGAEKGGTGDSGGMVGGC